MSVEMYRRKAELLLMRAAETTDLKERGTLIDQAVHWHNLALAEAALLNEPHDDERAKSA